MVTHFKTAVLLLAATLWCPSASFSVDRSVDSTRPVRPGLFSSISPASGDQVGPPKPAFDSAVLNRYACKRFRRFDGDESDPSLPSSSDPTVVQQALHCLEVARQAPSSFNTQPYKIVLVHSQEQKQALSRYCLGPNRQRVLDSDCTAVFLADQQVFRTLPRFKQLLFSQNPDRKPNRKMLWTIQFYITLFSSGYPLPRILAAPISFLVRTGMSFFNLFTRWFYPLPSLSSAETWSTKQVMLVAMTYMLGCSSRGLATIPMEGFNAGGLRRAINASSRYAIPVIVATGKAYKDDKSSRLSKTTSRRYPMNEVIFSDSFGDQLKLTPEEGVV